MYYNDLWNALQVTFQNCTNSENRLRIFPDMWGLRNAESVCCTDLLLTAEGKCCELFVMKISSSFGKTSHAEAIVDVIKRTASLSNCLRLSRNAQTSNHNRECGQACFLKYDNNWIFNYSRLSLVKKNFLVFIVGFLSVFYENIVASYVIIRP